MKKTILITVAILVLVSIGGVYYVLTNLNSIVEAAIEKYGSETIQTAVRVDSVDIELTAGKASIQGLTIANPDGFSAPHAFSLDRISVDIDLGSVGRQPVVINDVAVHAPEVFYEINKDNKDNISLLRGNLGRTDAEDKADASDPTTLLIRRIAFEDMTLHADVIPLERSYDVEVPSIRMSQLGAPDGATPPRIARQVLNELLDRVREEIEERGIDEARQELDVKKQQLEGEADEQLEEEKQQAREKLKSLLE